MEAEKPGFPFYLKLLFFSSLFLSLGNLWYSLFCPRLVRRFESANDLYERSLSIYERRQAAGLGEDGYEGDYEHVEKGYAKKNSLNPVKRGLCFAFYLVGAVLAVWLIWERSQWVWMAE
jgi:hypothetical protein